MLSDIRRIGGINIYFPFLDQKNGRTASLREEFAWVIVYSLFADKVLFPPRSLFSGKYAIQNLADLAKYPIFRYLTEAGVLITTATQSTIRDLGDLFERYSGLVSSSTNLIPDFAIYARDEKFQKQIASEYISDQLLLMDNLLLGDRQALISIVHQKLDHNDLVRELLCSGIVANSNAKMQISSTLSEGYFFAGAKGNAAITPPIVGEQPHTHFEFLYSKPVLRYFALEFQRQLKRPIVSITPDELRRVRENLSIFREQYLLISTKHRQYFCEVIALLDKSHPALRLRAPILGLQAAVATSIGLAIAPAFAIAAFPLAVTGKYVWEAISKGFKINDKISEVMRGSLVKYGILEPYTKDLLEVLESFDKGVKSTLVS